MDNEKQKQEVIDFLENTYTGAKMMEYKWIIKLDEKGEKSQNNIGVKRWNMFKIYTPLTQIGAITQVKDRIESIVNINQENER